MLNIYGFNCDWVENRNNIKVFELRFILADMRKIRHKSNPSILVM